MTAKIGEVENKIPDHAKNITTHQFYKLAIETFCSSIKARWFSKQNCFY